ncbi:hypothetical protein [Streptomyces odontomachi]|uniref:hypothetical protein n=1 Tax=Streptomyces odontomachi TaxID=2944940 RepID=UPI00210D4FD0|nr:hypothetical protein [Streptomyces sp. ODS25]
MTTTDSYLERAQQAGLLDETLGHRFVSDRYDDPFTGRRQVLVEYTDAGLPEDPHALGALCDRLYERHAAAQSILLRVVGDVRLPSPWLPRLTYIRHGSAENGAPPRPESAVGVRPAVPDDDSRIRDWLVQAFRNAYPGQEIAAGHSGIEGILTSPARRSFIAHVADLPIGHGTVLFDERDEVTGEVFAELVDILVDDAAHRRAATSALVAAAVQATRGRPLRGHVVHPREKATARQADLVLHALLRGDWSVDHVFWEHTW